MTKLIQTIEWREDPMTENWKPVVGYEGLYEVSDHGRVRSVGREVEASNRYGPVVRKLPGRVLKPGAGTSGYLHVCLYRDGQASMRQVHRLVLEAFECACPPGHQACHYDDDQTNNKLSNLRWGTPSENRLDSVRNGTHYWANKTHCPQGHEYTAENTYVRPSGNRDCRECKRAWNRTYKKKREAHRQLTGRSAR